MTESALKRLLANQSALQSQSAAPLEEIVRLDAEISALKNSAEQTEQAIASLTKRFKSGGDDGFGLGSKKF